MEKFESAHEVPSAVAIPEAETQDGVVSHLPLRRMGEGPVHLVILRAVSSYYRNTFLRLPFACGRAGYITCRAQCKVKMLVFVQKLV